MNVKETSTSSTSDTDIQSSGKSASDYDRRRFLKRLAGLGAGGALLLSGLYACSDNVSGPSDDGLEDPPPPPPETEKPEVPAGLPPAVATLLGAYIDRVYEDEGQIHELDKLAADLVFLEEENLLSSLSDAFVPYGGQRFSGSTSRVAQWYNLRENGDATQSQTSRMPTYQDQYVRFNEKVMRLDAAVADTIRMQPGRSFTAILVAEVISGSGYALSIADRFEVLLNRNNDATPRFNLNGSEFTNISRAGSSQGGIYANTLVYDGEQPDKADFYFNNVFEKSFDDFTAGEAGSADTPMFLGRRSETAGNSLQMRVYGLWVFNRALSTDEIAAFTRFSKAQIPGMGWHPSHYPGIQDEDLLQYLDTLHGQGGYLR